MNRTDCGRQHKAAPSSIARGDNRTDKFIYIEKTCITQVFFLCKLIEGRSDADGSEGQKTKADSDQGIRG